VAPTVSHENVAKSTDMSDVDRHLFGNYAAGLKPYVQRVRAYGELSSGMISAGSRRSGPFRFVAYVGILRAGGCQKSVGGI
jgi:hypothetical protein